MANLPRGTPGVDGWTYSEDFDPIHRDWVHGIDGDYEPKGTTRTIDGDVIVHMNSSTGHLPKPDPYSWL